MCESGLSGWMVRACFQAAMASGVFSTGSKETRLDVSMSRCWTTSSCRTGKIEAHGGGIQLPKIRNSTFDQLSATLQAPVGKVFTYSHPN